MIKLLKTERPVKRTLYIEELEPREDAALLKAENERLQAELARANQLLDAYSKALCNTLNQLKGE